jgi:hypothetical protein
VPRAPAARHRCELGDGSRASLLVARLDDSPLRGGTGALRSDDALGDCEGEPLDGPVDRDRPRTGSRLTLPAVERASTLGEAASAIGVSIDALRRWERATAVVKATSMMIERGT